MKNPLKIFNTISKKLEEFKPISSNNIKMYVCGPTVYDDSHIGHGRTYVMIDVIRSILEKYYNYNVIFVMNITDIDDKIINKSQKTGENMTSITKKYTKEFLEDMASLNVKLPTRLTKVTDYIDKICIFIDKLEKNGYAYKSNGSIYFDVEKYKEKFEYPIFKTIEGVNMDSCNVSDKNLISEKKNMADFALWKSSKPNDKMNENTFKPNVKMNENTSKSNSKPNIIPNENDINNIYDFNYKNLKGRPGWHIECSVMASDILGDSIDIHAGGIDLKFPHHENEIAQCQAYSKSKPWIKYFLHTGHLNIDGLKMSKSLKNFTTIREILKNNTPNQLRILFLNHQWNKDMNYDTGELMFAQNLEKKIKNFVSYVNSLKYDAYNDKFSKLKFEDTKDFEILKKLEEVKNKVDLAFSENFDTPEVLKKISELISFSNLNLNEVSDLSLISVKEFIVKILDILGVETTKQKEENEDVEILAEILSNFRNSVRKFAKEGKDSKELYGLCDELRDELKEKGFVIEDKKMESVIKRF